MTDQKTTLTPVGRMVQGHPMVANTTDMKGKPLTNSKNEPREEYYVAIAIPKTDESFNAFWAEMQRIALAGFPNGETKRADFAWKYLNGDDPKHASKEGFPGHHVLRCTGGFPPRVYTKNGESLIVEQNGIKRGDYIRMGVDIRANGDSTYPGLYLNPSLVELVGHGQEITSGPDAAAFFGGAPVATLPPGASETPVAGSPIATPPNQPSAQQTANNLPSGAPSTAAQTPPAGFTPPPGPAETVASSTPPPPPAASGPVYQMTAKAGSYTREQMHGSGWTDEKLIAQGYMVDQSVAPATDFLNGPPGPE